jgi:hypothetical protein
MRDDGGHGEMIYVVRKGEGQGKGEKEDGSEK